MYLDQKGHIRYVIKQVKFQFMKNWPLWYKSNKTPRDVKMSLYQSLILPHFMNGMYLFPLTHAMDVLHRKQLRVISRMQWPHKIEKY